jgi:hypothetical protein
MKYDVIFIPLNPYLPPYSVLDDCDEVPDPRWRAELHHDLARFDDWQFASWPLAAAWVYVYAFAGGEGIPEVRWIETPQPLRGRGYATLLTKGLFARWPELHFSEPREAEVERILAGLGEQ